MKTFETQYSITPRVTFHDPEKVLKEISGGNYSTYMNKYDDLEEFVDAFLYQVMLERDDGRMVEGRYRTYKFVEGFGDFLYNEGRGLYELVEESSLEEFGMVTFHIPNGGDVEVEWCASLIS
ncbi:hypothetical protein NVP1121O_162 [Vibrio phage 1.121.O._10N.286.46.C4]|nr:hypothetical protein NVP1121O_162 [Vibrio phage 1.121.O._10N.286.46.C4]